MASGKSPSASESHTRHNQYKVEGTGHCRGLSTLARDSVVEGRESAQEGGAVLSQSGLQQTEHQFPEETVERRGLLL